MELYEKGFKIQRELKDEEMWTMGIYVQRAVGVEVEHCLHGRKARSEYFDKPLLYKGNVRQPEAEDRELTPEEKKEAQERVLMQLKIMMSNFETSGMG